MRWQNRASPPATQDNPPAVRISPAPDSSIPAITATTRSPTIQTRIKACMRDRLEIMSGYRVLSLDEFEKKVQDGSIPEHPGWEDLITLENIETRVNKLKMELSHVGDISIT